MDDIWYLKELDKPRRVLFHFSNLDVKLRIWKVDRKITQLGGLRIGSRLHLLELKRQLEPIHDCYGWHKDPGEVEVLRYLISYVKEIVKKTRSEEEIAEDNARKHAEDVAYRARLEAERNAELQKQLAREARDHEIMLNKARKAEMRRREEEKLKSKLEYRAIRNLDEESDMSLFELFD